MKILMVITGMQSGGAERVMATLCNELSKRNQVRLAILKDDKSDYNLSTAVDIKAGKIKNQSVIQSVCFVKTQITDYQPDVVVSFMTKTNIVTLLAKILSQTSVPVVIAERANPMNAKLVFKIVRRFVYPKAQGAIFQTYDAQNYYHSIINCPSIVLRNPLNPDFSINPYEGGRSKKIVTVGRLSVEKNQKLLIRAFSQIADDFPEYTVEIFGDGPLHEELNTLIHSHGMQERIFLMGRKDNIQRYIQDAELFVLPSNSEGMPNALLEAMALGMACIATDCPIGGSAVIIDHEKSGLLIPTEDVDALINAIRRVLTDTELTDMFRENARDVTQAFDTKKVCLDWENFLGKISKAYQNGVEI